LSNSPFDEQNPQLSPDGRWLASTSDETGNYEVYVQSFSADGKLLANTGFRASGHVIRQQFLAP
jgi:Tol biopolymer transport system component